LKERAGAILTQLNNSALHRRIRRVTGLLSLFVILGVFWGLKLTGITMAGEAFCGMEEHLHTEACGSGACTLAEHIHLESCYSDITADLETQDDWERSLMELTRETSTAKMLAAVARSQLGYSESTLNFVVDDQGIRRGISRYGQWYGNPYGDWSAMFAAFCLHYSGVRDVPLNGGAEGMRVDWEQAGFYRAADLTQPQEGNIVFLGPDPIILTEPEPTPVEPEPTPVEPEPTPVEPEPTPVEPEPTPVEPEPTPVEPEPTPVEPELTPVEPEPAPVEPEPTPVEPETIPIEPEPTPVEPEPTPVEPEPTPVEPEPTPVEPETIPIEPEPAPVEPEPTPVEPEPTPVEPEPTPIEPEPTSVEPEPTPVEPEPTPIEPESTPVEPEPTPAEPEPTPVEPEPTPVEPELTPVEPEPAPVEPEPAPVEPEPTPVEPEPAPVEPEPAPVEPEIPDAVLEYLNQNRGAAAVGIVVEVTEEGITVIQGDLDGTVALRTLSCDDPAILGYGLVPERSPYVMMAAPRAAQAYVARTINYSSSMFTSGRSFLLYTVRAGVCYAIDGNANAVPVQIGDDGSIYSAADPSSLLWTFTPSGSRYVIANLGTGMYLHPFYNSASDNGLLSRTGWDTPLTQAGTGVKLIHSASATLNSDATAFTISRSQGDAATFYFGVAEMCTVWLDGTNGGLMSLAGSPVESRAVSAGSDLILPGAWGTPEKYSYTLRGWYDVGSGSYYLPGEQITVTGNMLLYADWRAETYDIGQMNEDVVGTVSTNKFITTRMFDYGTLFNTLSMRNNYSGGSSAEWTLVESGTLPNTGRPSLNFAFIDHDGTGTISQPRDRNQANGVDYTVVTPDLYTPELADILFNPERPVLGKEYLGLGDHLFRYGGDPADAEHYGYFYYDSQLNAASYNQSNQRFYVYNYLERTTDSANNGSYADFLPLNSPYANTNGKATGYYNYDGVHSEYVGVPHMAYDAKYSDSNNSPNRIATNYWFGMSMDLEFYLPSVPGTTDGDGVRANQSITGDDMVFEFAGDDDLWVLVDGQLVLDIGGIHGREAGSINFSTGEVIVDGVRTGTVSHLTGGSHVLTMYYLERGASMSNFKLRFNLSTRYAMTLRKEDTLTADLLNGAQFAVFTDENCTRPAELWTSKTAHENGAAATHIFTVQNGSAAMWGLAAGNTYYLQEIRGPDTMSGVPAQGVIRMRLNNQGLPDYQVLADSQGHLTVGYTVHGYKVNEDTQEAFLSVTNTDATESEPTTVYVEKVWGDAENHSGDSVTVYLVANGIRIQSRELNAANGWKYTWVNLPKTDRNGVQVVYSVQEATVPGYVGEVTEIGPPDSSGSGGGSVSDADGFTTGQTYLLHTRFGYLGAAGDRLQLDATLEDALSYERTQWVATVHGDGTVTLTNKLGQTLYYDNYTFKASSSPGIYRGLSFANGTMYCFINHGGWSETLYPVDNENVGSNVIYNGVFYTTGNLAEALAVTPQRVGAAQPEPEPQPPADDGGDYFRITNIPAGSATVSLRVNKLWDLGNLGTPSQYEESGVQMRLLANGADSGLVATLTLQNGWTHTFTDLPKFDSGGSEIVYTVEEIDLHEFWRIVYGPVTSVNGSQTAYETTVTNVYRATLELPSTGGLGGWGHIILGLLIMIGGLGWYCGLRRKEERRACR